MVGVIPCILQMRKQAQIGDMIESRGRRGAPGAQARAQVLSSSKCPVPPVGESALH